MQADIWVLRIDQRLVLTSDASVRASRRQWGFVQRKHERKRLQTEKYDFCIRFLAPKTSASTCICVLHVRPYWDASTNTNTARTQVLFFWRQSSVCDFACVASEDRAKEIIAKLRPVCLLQHSNSISLALIMNRKGRIYALPKSTKQLQ